MENYYVNGECFDFTDLVDHRRAPRMLVEPKQGGTATVHCSWYNEEQGQWVRDMVIHDETNVPDHVASYMDWAEDWNFSQKKGELEEEWTEQRKKALAEDIDLVQWQIQRDYEDLQKLKTEADRLGVVYDD